MVKGLHKISKTFTLCVIIRKYNNENHYLFFFQNTLIRLGYFWKNAKNTLNSPTEVLMDHQTILMIDRCHNFKLGHFFNLKDLNSHLFMFFVKCLQNSNKTIVLSCHFYQISLWCLMCGNSLAMRVRMVVLLSVENTLMLTPTDSKYRSSLSQAFTSISLLHRT